jgi:addiction module RelB/DinJ family antitoxin
LAAEIAVCVYNVSTDLIRKHSMPQDSRVQYRIDTATKDAAYSVFRDLGLTPSEAVRVFFTQVQRTQSIPFLLSNIESANDSHELDYQEWLQARLAKTVKALDSGQMPSYPTETAKVLLKQRLALKRRAVAGQALLAA